MVADRTCDGADSDRAALWTDIETRGGRLPPQERLWVRDAIANSVLEGYQLDPEGIERLIAFAVGELSMAEYKHQVLASVGVRHETGESSCPN